MKKYIVLAGLISLASSSAFAAGKDYPGNATVTWQSPTTGTVSCSASNLCCTIYDTGAIDIYTTGGTIHGQLRTIVSGTDDNGRPVDPDTYEGDVHNAVVEFDAQP